MGIENNEHMGIENNRFRVNGIQIRSPDNVVTNIIVHALLNVMAPSWVDHTIASRVEYGGLSTRRVENSNPLTS
jgi:hypothetical protein